MSFLYSVVTFGCRVNQADSLGFEEELLSRGGMPAAASQADVVIVNTCSVTAASDQGARQTIRQIARQNPSARIVVTGCYATRCPEEVADLPGVVRVVPNELKERLLEEIGTTTAQRFDQGEGPCGAVIAPGLMGRTAYTVRVQTGCDEPCSYCIIPSTRGHSRSRPLDDVLREIARVAAAGFREIAITGVHLGSYGKDLPEPSTLLKLLRRISELALDDVLFRISSLEPMDCSDEIVDLVARSGTFAPHFHLPLQHASDRLLSRMRRPYTLAQYRQLVDGIRERMAHASVGSDLIVGFPGETNEDAELLDRYLEACPLTHVHVFPYSDRPGTAATALTSKVHGLDVRRRAAEARERGRSLAERFYRSQVGSVRRGLTIDAGALVVTDNYLKVHIAPGLSRNEWVRVEIPPSPSSVAPLLQLSAQDPVCTD